MKRTTTLLILPSEVLETILICSRSPRTVTSVAQTSRTLHTLVYSSPDSHLWRELFLTTWDDPRPALEHRALVDPRINPTAWDWGTEYRKRVSADRWLKAWRRNICLTYDKTSEDGDTEWCTTTLSTLFAVLDTLLTLRPFPTSPPTVLVPPIPRFSTGNAGLSMDDRREHTANAPPLPPLLTVLASGFSAFEESQSGVRMGRIVYGPHASRVLVNKGKEPAEWIPIPTPSLPPQLVRTLLTSHTVGVRGFPAYTPNLSGAEYWEGDVLGDVFHRIICITRFVPIPPPLDSVSTSMTMSTSVPVSDHTLSPSADVNNGLDTENEADTHGDEQGQTESHNQELDEQSMGRIPEPFPTPSQQHADARTLARRRVYDMQYLRGDRLWGPFQPVTKESLNLRSGASLPDVVSKANFHQKKSRFSTSGPASGRRGLHGLDTLAWAMGVEVGIDLNDLDSPSDDNSGDEDWRDPAEIVLKAPSSYQGRDHEHEQVTGGGDAAMADGADHGGERRLEKSLVSLVLPSIVDSQPTTNLRSSRRKTHRSNPRLPSNRLVSPRNIRPGHLRPDYTYLASVRIVVEANVRELLESEISDNVVGAASEPRVGGVGMFWEDEDEILQAQAEHFEQARASSSPTTIAGGTSSANTNSRAFKLADILSKFQNLEVARLGSACGYWSAWTNRQVFETPSIDENAGASTSSSKGNMGAKRSRIVIQRAQFEKPIEGASTIRDKGKGKETCRGTEAVPILGGGLGDWEIGPENEACEGWDWAGVAGIWRRCVCWMDYRELLFFNLDPPKFLTLGTQEACRIIPMELRITGYTRAALMPVYDTKPSHDGIIASPSNERHGTSIRYFRPPPVIHFSGSSSDSDRGMEDGRSVRGSVQLIGGGEVKWHLDTYPRKSTLSGSSKPEWSSEAVQIGGIGSAVGVLGMWTGARHESSDPLGPFWAWKVV